MYNYDDRESDFHLTGWMWAIALMASITIFLAMWKVYDIAVWVLS